MAAARWSVGADIEHLHHGQENQSTTKGRIHLRRRVAVI
jgi:hypothetical protein